MAGFRKGFLEREGRALDAASREMAPVTSCQCKALGCRFPADTGRAGSDFLCTYHTGVQAPFWGVVTKAINPYWPLMQLAVLHDRNFNDMEAADAVIQAINGELAKIAPDERPLVSELQLFAAGKRGAGDYPMILIPKLIQKALEKAVVEKAKTMVKTQASMTSPVLRVKAACQRILKRMDGLRSGTVSKTKAEEVI